jgi:hypothetical protein
MAPARAPQLPGFDGAVVGGVGGTVVAGIGAVDGIAGGELVLVEELVVVVPR